MPTGRKEQPTMTKPKEKTREERRTRSHRLIVRGAIFESIVPEAKTMTDEEAADLLRLALTGEDTAHIQTYNAGLRKRLAAFSKKHPDLCRLEKSFAQGGVIYVLDKSRLSIRLQAPYSEERRRKASESAKQTGFKSRTE